MEDGQFEELFNRHGPLVWAMIRRFGTPDPEAEDLFVEIWEAVWRSLDGFAGRARLSTWIARIAKNKCVDHSRRRRLQPTEDTKLELLLESGDGPARLSRPPLPRDEAISDELREVIETALEGLSTASRMIVSLWMAGHKYRIIADLLRQAGLGDFDTNSVGKKLFEAKARLRSVLKKSGINFMSDILE
jgi:RNA polymerase sigma-70 factor (ECF subfamily)